MNYKDLKKLIIPILIFAILLAYSLFNNYVIKRSLAFDDELYSNDISKKIFDNKTNDINYEMLYEDVRDIDSILKEQLNLNVDKKIKSSYYKIAANVFKEKANEIIKVLNDRLDDEDFLILSNDMDEFQNNIEYALKEIYDDNESSVDAEFYANKYEYEERQRKCYELLETYKGFLTEKE